MIVDRDAITVASKSTEGTVVTMHNVDLLKSGEVRKQGRISTGPEFYSEYVEYVVKVGGVIEDTEENPSTVEFVDVDEVNKKRVQKNGHLILGKKYEGKQVAVALRKLDEPAEESDSEPITV
jgi:hypothetical protein